MPKILSLVHTAEVHSDTFDALRDRIAPGLALHHHIRTDWLDRAQVGMSPELAQEIRQTVQDSHQPVICTCTTIAPVAENAGAIRIDQPMMQEAARLGGPVIMAYCLESTKEPSLELLLYTLLMEKSQGTAHLLPLTHLWPLFMSGRIKDFHAEIASAIREKIDDFPPTACVVLAQASMAGAAALLTDLPVPVLTSPELALRAGLAQL
ncbi:hypothetical protein [uncultured Roseovarius sp.]|uniref:hypothetical protein n=1 Tax=uncultured Roseovarius sp. TaxID=293344 RepID=UPI0026316C11|nr:hypothetical protein [uncultured Roseovarius sp.]